VIINQPGVYDITPAHRLEVPLSRGDVALINSSDWAAIEGYAWKSKLGNNGKRYACVTVGRITIYMHRVILGAPKGFEVDHINGDGLDNRRENLRLASQSQNSANTGKPKRPDGSAHTSQFKGVTWDPMRRKWQSKITVLGKCRSLGRFLCEEEAARAYDLAALSTWGEFAQLNFPIGVEK